MSGAGELTPAVAPLWRSLLYVPASNRRFVARAHERGADAVVLDLEDGVAFAAKPAARAALGEAIASAGRGGADVLVRVNATAGDLEADLDAAVRPGLAALVVPKVEAPGRIADLASRLAPLERARGIAPGRIRFALVVEGPGAVLDARAIAGADSRVVSLGLGSEDFALATGMEPAADTLAVPRHLVLLAARAAGVMPLGLLGSIADFRDLDALRAGAVGARRFGFEGAACVHPSNVAVLNEAFTPDPAEVERARRVVEAWASRDAGAGAVAIDGRMVDAPIVARARAVLERRLRISTKERITDE